MTTTIAGPQLARRGTSNGNARGSAADRRARRAWLLATFGDGTTCPCYRCGCELTDTTITVDRKIPGRDGGTYRRGNIRPACLPCNSETGGALARGARVCAGTCGRLLQPGRARTTRDQARHAGRGLCNGCHHRAQRAGTLADYPRALRGRDELLDDWETLRAGGISRAEAALRLGMTLDGLNTALRRARAAGDERAAA